jgi:hypothetical protein
VRLRILLLRLDICPPSVALQTPGFAKLRETIFPKPRNHPETGGFLSKGMTSTGTWRKDECDGRVSIGRRGFG